jgi:hypothetical protein
MSQVSSPTKPTKTIGPTSRKSMTRQPRLSALILLGYAVVALALFWTTWLNPGDHLVAYGGDAIQQLWELSAALHALTHGVSPFYTYLMNYPHGVNMIWTPTPFGLLPIFAIFNFWGGPVLAYNSLLIVILALNAWTGYLACSRWAHHRAAAVVGGFVFGFGPAAVAQALNHPFLAALFFLPLALIGLDELVVRQAGSARNWGLLLGLVAAGQFYIAEEVWGTMGLLGACGLIWLAILNIGLVRTHWRYLLIGLSWAAGLMAVLIATPIIFQFFGPGVVHGSPLSPAGFSGDLAGFLVPNWLQALTIPALGPLALRADFVVTDFSFYLGLPVLLVLGTLGWSRWRDRQVSFFLGWTIIIAILILGPTLRLLPTPGGLPLPTAFLQHIPLLDYYLPVRLDLYLDLGVAILLTMFIDKLTWKRADLGLRALAILAVASWLPTLTYPTTAVSAPTFLQHEQLPSKDSLLIIPFASQVNNDEAMLWQVIDEFQFAIPEGYFTRTSPSKNANIGPAPTPFANAILNIQAGGAVPPVTPKLMTQANNYLRQHHVTMTVLGPTEREQTLRQWLSKIFGQSPTQKEGVYIWDGKPSP